MPRPDPLLLAMQRPARLLLAVVFAATAAPTADAQIWNRAKRAAQRGVERAVERQVEDRSRRATEDAIDAMFDAGEDAVRCVFSDQACINDAQARGEAVVLTDRDGAPVDRDGAPVTEANAEAAVVRAADRPRPGAPMPGVTDAGFDFEPGPRTLFADDFEGTRTGNVPGSIRFVRGEIDVVEDRGNKVLRVLPGSIFGVPMGDRPDLFTLEFEVFLAEEGSLCITTTDLGEYSGGSQMRTCNQATAWMDMASLNVVGVHPSHLVKTGFTAPSDSRSGTGEYGDYPALNERYVPVRATLDGTYLKVYFDETRVVNIPNVALDPRSELIFFVEDNAYRTRGDDGARVAYFDNVRVGAGGQETGYARLSTGDRVTAEGILFESGSARLTPSSRTDLSRLLAALEDNAALRVRVEGHTDAAGGADANRQLSQRRAEAVVDWLVGRGIAPSRLEAVGVGEDRPVASNDTPAGREQNRRVEIVGL